MAENRPAKAGDRMPDYRFLNRQAGEFVTEVLREKANKGRIVLFGLPGDPGPHPLQN